MIAGMKLLSDPREPISDHVDNLVVVSELAVASKMVYLKSYKPDRVGISQPFFVNPEVPGSGKSRAFVHTSQHH